MSAVSSPTAAGAPSAKHPIEPFPPGKLDPLAAFLSYLIPGLGQVYQGRIGKGLLFFFSLYALFFYGQWMGQWRNVFLPDPKPLPPAEISVRFFTWNLEGIPKAIYYRPQFAGQFWMGIAAWPALIQNYTFDRANPRPLPVIGTYQLTPSEDELNDLQRRGNKRWDLGWVFTVIAGVLNLLVIYDAFAGPMFRDPPPSTKPPTPSASGGAPPPPGPTPEPAVS